MPALPDNDLPKATHVRLVIIRALGRRNAQSGAVAQVANSVQLDRLRAATVAGWAVAAGHSPDAAALGAAGVLGSPHEASARAGWAISHAHGVMLFSLVSQATTELGT